MCSLILSLTQLLLWAPLGEGHHSDTYQWGLPSGHLPGTESNSSAHRGVTNFPKYLGCGLWFRQLRPGACRGPGVLRSCVGRALQPGSAAFPGPPPGSCTWHGSLEALKAIPLTPSVRDMEISLHIIVYKQTKFKQTIQNHF